MKDLREREIIGLLLEGKSDAEIVAAGYREEEVRAVVRRYIAKFLDEARGKTAEVAFAEHVIAKAPIINLCRKIMTEKTEDGSIRYGAKDRIDAAKLLDSVQDKLLDLARTLGIIRQIDLNANGIKNVIGLGDVELAAAIKAELAKIDELGPAVNIIELPLRKSRS